MIRNRPRNSFGDSFLGGDLEFEFAFSKKMSVSLGGRYTHTSDLTERFSLAEGPSGQFNDSGYQNDLPLNSYIDLTTNTSAFGAWLDFNFFGLRMGRSVLLKFGVGIDAEIYNLNISATSSLPASTGEIKSVDYSNNGRTAVTLSGRVPIDFSYNTRSFGVGIKVIPMFSFLSMDLDKGNNIINGPELDPTTVSSINDLSVVTKWEEALDEDLGFGAGGISLEIQAIYFAYYF